MKKNIIAIVCLLFFNVVIGQKIYTGIVVDAVSKEPITYANIQIKRTGAVTQTDDKGLFTIKNADKEILVIISHIGHQSLSTVLLADTYNNIWLQKGVINLKETILINGTQNINSVISKVDLNLRPAKSAQDLLKLVPGLFIAQHQGGGKAEQIFLRGFDIDHGTDIQISVDGLPVNMVSHSHGQGYADLHFVIPELVKNIDYGKGPYYTEHGNLGTAGYVNLQTVKQLEQSKLSLEVGQFNTFRGLTMIDLLKKNKEKQSAYIAGEYLFSNGPFESKQRFNRTNIIGKYNLHTSNSSSIHFMQSYFYSNWNASGQVPERAIANGSIGRFGAIDDKEGGSTARYNTSIEWKKRFANSSIEQQLYYSKYKFNLFSNFTFFLNDSINGDQIKQAEDRAILGYNGKLRFHILPNQKDATTIGIGFRIDKTQNSELSHTKNKIEILERLQLGNIKEQNYFLYADQKFTWQKVSLNLGARIDYFSFAYFNKLTLPQLPVQIKAIVSPKLNIQYTVNKKLQLYFKSGKGFHSNDTRVVVPSKGIEILPAAYGSDIGMIIKPIPKLYINTSLWYLYLQNELVYVGDEAIIEPSGKTRRIGIDFSAHYQLDKHIIVDANINLAKPRSIENIKGEDYIPLAPTFTSTGGISYQNKNGYNGSLRYRYLKNRAANEDNTVIAKGYTIVDAAFNYTKKKYEIGIGIENLLNVKWNEAQFNTTSRLQNEPNAVTELHFTPGVPFFAKIKYTIFF
jgi:hypothetical protein